MKKQKKISPKKTFPAVLPVAIEREKAWTFILGGTFTYFLLVTFGIWNHEMWRDEIQPFLTASSCYSLGDFFNTWKFQSDTLGWYTTLFLLSKLSLDPAIVQIFHGALATVNVYLLLRYAPFSRVHKILLCCGYYLLFEYGILGRGYAYTIFFLFLFCIIYHISPKRYILLSFILVLLANATGGYGLVLSGSLALVLLSRFFFDKNNRFYFPDSYKEVLLIVIIIGAGLWFAMKSITPPEDSVYKQALFLKYDPKRFFLNFWKPFFAAFVAMPDIFNLHFWNKNIFINHTNSLLNACMIIFAFAVFTYCILLFSLRLTAIIFYLSTTIGMLLFSYINDHIFIGFYARHYGFLFITFVVSTWLYTDAPAQRKFSLPLLGFLAVRIRSERVMKYVLTFLFAINAAGGVAAYAMDIVHPFSTIQAAAKYILNNHLEHLPATGFTDYAISPVAAYTRKPIYYPDRDTTNVFVVWTVSKYSTDPNQIIPRMINFINRHPDSVLVILNFNLNTTMIGNVQFTYLSGFTESVVADETIYLYLAEKFDLAKELDRLSKQVDENKIPGYISLAQSLLQQQNTEDCEKILNRIRTKAVEKKLPGFHSTIGMLYLKKNMPGEAKEEFHKEINLGLKKEEAFFQLGFLHYQEQKTDSAIYDWEKVIEISPSNIDAYNNLAVVYFNFKKDYSKAQIYWEKTVLLNPKYFQGYLNLMINSQHMKNEEIFLKYLKSALNNGMSLDEIRSKGIVVTDQILARIK